MKGERTTHPPCQPLPGVCSSFLQPDPRRRGSRATTTPFRSHFYIYSNALRAWVCVPTKLQSSSCRHLKQLCRSVRSCSLSVHGVLGFAEARYAFCYHVWPHGLAHGIVDSIFSVMMRTSIVSLCRTLSLHGAWFDMAPATT